MSSIDIFKFPTEITLMFIECLSIADQAVAIDTFKRYSRYGHLLAERLPEHNLLDVLYDAMPLTKHPALSLFALGIADSLKGDPDTANKALLYASQSNCADLVQILLNSAAPRHEFLEMGLVRGDRDYSSPLRYSLDHGFTEAVGVFMDAGAVLSTHLHNEPRYTCKADSVAATNLHATAMADRTDLLNLILERGNINVDHVDQHGTTPLLRASEAGRVEAVTTLLSRGPDIHAVDCCGLTSFDWAAQNSHTLVLSLLVKVVLSREHPADTNINYNAVLLQAVSRNFSTDVKMLLLSGWADVNAHDQQGRSALCIAASLNNLASAKVLLRFGAHVNQASNNGRTPLSSALEKCDTGIGRILVECQDCDKYKQDMNGYAPIDYVWARRRPHFTEPTSWDIETMYRVAKKLGIEWTPTSSDFKPGMTVNFDIPKRIQCR
ncbi:ankyrin repeat domain-containing protein [Aspergillus stella-maris]|uniref:ankyrin repeat domain-containing protein n=1 Tax=Aspergillus stella-maris TaxID=1810926 RepID=UPI003CCD78BD